VIGVPINDRRCLDQVTEVVAEMVRQRDPVLVDVARRFASVDDLIDWIRGLPQRDDDGDPYDGPKLACSPPQRLRIPAPNPNCFERSALLLGVAELMDPRPSRCLITVDTSEGRHTFPLQDGQPVVLDPVMTRNTLLGAMAQMTRGPIEITPREATDWIASIAEEPAARRGETHRVHNARNAMRRAISGRRLTPRALEDVAHTVALGEREARRFGTRGVALHRQTATGLATALAAGNLRARTAGARNAGLELRIGGLTIRPNISMLSALARVGGRIGTQVGIAALQSQLGRIGLTPSVLGELEREMSKEGLSLGAFAAPAPAGSLAALGRDAILAGALRNSARNASWWAIKTPGVIWDEMMTTQNEIYSLGRDIYATFRRPFEEQQALALARFEKTYGRKAGVGREDIDPEADFAQVYAWMDPRPTREDIEFKSYQGGFVGNWGAFEKEWDDFTGSHNAWYKRMWKGDYDKAIEFRERAVKWRDEFKQLGGRPTTPVPTLPEDVGIPWRSIIMVAGIGAAALIVPEALRTLRSSSASTASAPAAA
jgi:hypothetical protein